MIEEESSERMFRIILLSNQKKNKSVSCFSCLQTYYTRRKGQLDGPRDKVYRDISNKYLPEIRRILGTVKKQQ